MHIYWPTEKSYCPVGINPNAPVWDRDGVQHSVLLVRKIQIRNPEAVDIFIRYVDGIIRGMGFEFQPRIDPRLSKIKVRRKLLQIKRKATRRYIVQDKIIKSGCTDNS